jgi:uncharacterized protein (TIGR00251 family)
MRITVRVKPNSGKQEVKVENDVYTVTLNSPPLEGKANRELIEVLADYFNVPKSRIDIVSGHKGRVKIVDIKVEG